MAATSWLSRLGSLTASYHPTADTQRLAVMDVAAPAAYRAFLERVYGFESAVELRAATTPIVAEAAAGARARIYRLHQDLLALGLSDADIAAIPQPLVDGRSPSDSLGYLFAIERHTLLAGLVRRYLAPRLGDTFARARAYFDAHTDGGKHFREFGDELTASLTRKETRPEAILAAARRAFETQQQWYARSSRATRRPRRASDVATPTAATPTPRDAA